MTDTTARLLLDALDEYISAADAELEAAIEEPERRARMLRKLRDNQACLTLLVRAADLNHGLGDNPESVWTEGQKEYLRGQVELICDYAGIGTDDGGRELVESLIVCAGLES